MTHTPTPWKYYPGTRSIYGDGEVAVCVLSGPRKRSSEKQDTNGAFIVRAVNAHDELVAALKECRGLAEIAETLTGCRSDDDYVAGVKAKIDAALSRTEGEQT